MLLSYLKKKKTKNLMILDILSICIHLGPLLQPLKGSKEAITLFFSNFQFLVCLLKTYAKIWKIESQSIVILVSNPLSDIFRDFGDFRDFLWSDLSTSTPWPLLNFDKIIDIPFLLAQNNIKFARKKGLSLNFAFLSKGPHPPYRLIIGIWALKTQKACIWAYLLIKDGAIWCSISFSTIQSLMIWWYKLTNK